jgi:hypothetical protein
VSIKVTPEDKIFDLVVTGINAINKKNLIIGKPLLSPILYDDSGLPIIHYGKKNDLLTNKSDKIIIDAITEGYNAILFVEKYNLPKEKTYYFFSNGNWDTNSAPPLASNIINIDFPYFLTNFSPNLNYTSFWFDKSIFNYCNNGKFCALIGKKKHWRSQLINKIFQSNLENNFISYEGQRLGKFHIEDIFAKEEYDSYKPYLENDFFSISSSIPINIFSSTSFCLVAETNMYNFEEFHLTEKTIKCLSTGMPFVMASSFRFLKNLKKLGFKTYDELWDESYDDICDVEKRTNAIILLCKELQYFNWESAREKLNNIAFYNLRQLNNLQEMLTPKIINIVEKLNGH